MPLNFFLFRLFSHISSGFLPEKSTQLPEVFSAGSYLFPHAVIYQKKFSVL
jgi:hypothetical protein